MSPFGHLPQPPADESDRRCTADILAREVTPAPTSGVLPQFWCVNEDCKHTSAGPTRLCPVCADAPVLEESA